MAADKLLGVNSGWNEHLFFSQLQPSTATLSPTVDPNTMTFFGMFLLSSGHNRSRLYALLQISGNSFETDGASLGLIIAERSRLWLSVALPLVCSCC